MATFASIRFLDCGGATKYISKFDLSDDTFSCDISLEDYETDWVFPEFREYLLKSLLYQVVPVELYPFPHSPYSIVFYDARLQGLKMVGDTTGLFTLSFYDIGNYVKYTNEGFHTEMPRTEPNYRGTVNCGNSEAMRNFHNPQDPEDVIKTGDMFIVDNDGPFHAEMVRGGDQLIAINNNPRTIRDWYYIPYSEEENVVEEYVDDTIELPDEIELDEPLEDSPLKKRYNIYET